jgi:hypothetical protein
MLNLIVPPEISGQIRTALEKAARHEVGGVLLAEHVGPDAFAVREITVHRRGAIASFVPSLMTLSAGSLRSFRV